jgi:altronate dehydratase small subunit
VPQDAVLLDENDNVATALRDLESGSCVRLDIGAQVIAITLGETIPLGHKFAMLDIESGQPIVKYGQAIGLATRRIPRAAHVHVHNVEGVRGRGDRQ